MDEKFLLDRLMSRYDQVRHHEKEVRAAKRDFPPSGGKPSLTVENAEGRRLRAEGKFEAFLDGFACTVLAFNNRGYRMDDPLWTLASEWYDYKRLGATASETANRHRLAEFNRTLREAHREWSEGK